MSSLIWALARLGCTRIGSPGIFGVQTSSTMCWAVNQQVARERKSKSYQVSLDGRLQLRGVTKPPVAGADRIMSKGPLAVRLAKIVIRAGLDADRRTGQAIERLAQSLLCTSDDKREGTEAVPAKRRPEFTRT